MKDDYFYLGAVLDRSGSMSMGGKIEEARNGFNEFIKEKKKEKHNFDVCLTIFDNDIDEIYNGKIEDCPKLTNVNFFSRGMTSLYDAVGTTINTIGETLYKLKEEDKPKQVIILIITDGNENNSSEFNKKQITDMIKHQQEKYSWDFQFFGADLNSIEDAKDLGFKGVYSIDNNSRGMTQSFANYGATVNSYTK